MTPSNPSPDTGAGTPLTADGWFGEHDALWTDPKPTTPEGQHLWRLFMLGKLGTSPAGIRDFGQRICQIEAEAAARSRPATDPAGLDAEWAMLRNSLSKAYVAADIDAALAAARPRIEAAVRPATDPAGLDVERLVYEVGVGLDAKKWHQYTDWFDRATILDVVRHAVARLSVADGPEPEERLDHIDIAACEALGAAVEETPWPPTLTDSLAENQTGHGAVIAADLYRRGYAIAALPEHREETGRS